MGATSWINSKIDKNKKSREYLIKKILENAPFEKGEIFEIVIPFDYYPKISIISDKISKDFSIEVKDLAFEQFLMSILGDDNHLKHGSKKGYADIKYIENIGNSIAIGIIVYDSKKLYDKLNKLDYNTINKNIPPKYKEDPPRIIWGDTQIFIPHDSNQHFACRILFSRKKGEIVSWDEIMEEIKGKEVELEKNDWRTVYDAVMNLNKKVKEKTGKNIFETSRKSFHRIR